MWEWWLWLTGQWAHWRQFADDSRQTIQFVTAERDAWVKDVGARYNEIEKQKQEIERLTKKVAKLTYEVAEKDQVNRNLSADNGTLRKRVVELESQLAEAEQLREQLEESRRLTWALRTRLDIIRDKIRELEEVIP